MATLGSKLSYRLLAITAEKPGSSVPNTAQVLMQRLLETLDSVQDVEGPISRTLIDELQARLLPDALKVTLPSEDRIALSRWQEQLAKRLMMEQLDDGLSVSEIASAARCREAIFPERSRKTQAFRHVTGTGNYGLPRPSGCF